MGGRTLLPAVTRTMQYAADIAALLRWRLAMTRAVLPHTSAREQRLLSVLVEKNWLAPPLDGGGDDDADVGTDTTVPDDGDIALSDQENTIADADDL